MKITLPELPYAKNALEPVISENTINFHYGKHHQAYVDKLNQALEAHKAEFSSLEAIVKTQDAKYFNNAAQVWNHTFFWESLTPESKKPGNAFTALINQSSYTNLDDLISKFIAEAMSVFGSGWVWLVKQDEKLTIEKTQNAETPITDDNKNPLFVIDLWEHAFYLDYQNDKKSYLDKIMQMIDWDRVELRLTGE